MAASAVLFATRALNRVDLPTLGRPTMPVFSAMEVTAVERNPRFEPGAAVKARPVKALDLARRVAAPEVRATSLVACMAMADMVRGQTTGAKAASQWCELTGGDRLGTHIWIK